MCCHSGFRLDRRAILGLDPQPLCCGSGRAGRLAVDVPVARYPHCRVGVGWRSSCSATVLPMPSGSRLTSAPCSTLTTSWTPPTSRPRPQTRCWRYSRIRRSGAFGLIYFCIQSGVYAINFWLPSIIKNLGFSDTLVIGWLSAIPYLLAAVFMLLVGPFGRLAQRTALAFGGADADGRTGVGDCSQLRHSTGHCHFGADHRHHGCPHRPADVLACAHCHAQCRRGCWRAWHLINSMGQMAGFLSPYLVGFVKDATGSTDAALYLLAAVIVGGSVLALAHDPRHASHA
jgi:hypothetical protein